MKPRNIIIQLMTVFLLAGINLPAQAQEIENGEPVKGQYINNDYGFMVTIPDGLIGYLPPQPAIEHGFTVAVAKADKAYAWVHGTTIPTGEKTLEEVLKDQLY